MKPAVKYTIFSILYASEEKGIWEYDIYQKLKPVYGTASISKLREVLVEFATKSWVDIVTQKLYGEEVLRKYKLQNRHREFLEYQLGPPYELLDELNISVDN